MTQQRQMRRLEEDPVLREVQKWQDAEGGRTIQASVALIQQALTPKGKTPFTTAECLMLMLNCRALGLDPFRKQMMLVRFAEGGAATLITAYQTFVAAADRSGSYLPPEIFIKQEEKGKPIYGWARARRSDWPEGIWQYYPAQGNVLMFEQAARYKPASKGGGLMATWAGPAAYHQFWKTLLARIVRATWPAATERMYLAEEFGGGIADGPVAPEAVYQEPPAPPAQEGEVEVPAPPAPPDLQTEAMPAAPESSSEEGGKAGGVDTSAPPASEAPAASGETGEGAGGTEAAGSEKAEADWTAEGEDEVPASGRKRADLEAMKQRELGMLVVEELRRVCGDDEKAPMEWLRKRHGSRVRRLADISKESRISDIQELETMRDGELRGFGR